MTKRKYLKQKRKSLEGEQKEYKKNTQIHIKVRAHERLDYGLSQNILDAVKRAIAEGTTKEVKITRSIKTTQKEHPNKRRWYYIVYRGGIEFWILYDLDMNEFVTVLHHSQEPYAVNNKELRDDNKNQTN